MIGPFITKSEFTLHWTLEFKSAKHRFCQLSIPVIKSALGNQAVQTLTKAYVVPTGKEVGE